jgi:hypothetical protein
MSANNVVLAGIGGPSMSSSSSTDDEIPYSVRRIFDNPNTEDWFTVFYMTEDNEVIGRAVFFFEGRDQSYEEIMPAERDGTFAKASVIFRGQLSTYEIDINKQRSFTKGKPFRMRIKGEVIP